VFACGVRFVSVDGEMGGPIRGREVGARQSGTHTGVREVRGEHPVAHREAVNTADEEFGEKRLVEAALRGRQLSAEALHDFLFAAVAEFCGGEFEDDATLLVVLVS
jgi:hypothetical protein